MNREQVHLAAYTAELTVATASGFLLPDHWVWGVMTMFLFIDTFRDARILMSLLDVIGLLPEPSSNS